MKRWSLTIWFSSSILLAYSLFSLCSDWIHQYYFRRFAHNDALWTANYAEMVQLQNMTGGLIAAVVLFICIAFLLSSVRNMKQGKSKSLLLQAVIAQSAVLIVQTGLAVISVLAVLIGLLNVLVALLTLPVFFLFVGFSALILELASALSGIASVLAMKREDCLTGLQVPVHCVLQFIPLVNIIDCLILRRKCRSLKTVG